MFIRIISLLIILGNLYLSSFANDTNEILISCRQACENNSASANLIKQEEKWHILGLNISLDMYTDFKFEQLSKLVSLRELKLYKDGEINPQGIRSIADLPYLRNISLEIKLNDKVLEEISTITKLEELNLKFSHVLQNKAELTLFSNLQNLRILKLGVFGLDDKSLEYILAMKKLEILDLVGNDSLTDNGISKLDKLQILRYLKIDKLGPKGLSGIKKLHNLDHLDIINGFYPGSEKIDLSVLDNLKYLGIDINQEKYERKIPLPNNLQQLKLFYSSLDKLDIQSSPHIENLIVDLERAVGRDKTSKDLSWIEIMPELRELSLDWAADIDVLAISKLTYLRSLSVIPGCGLSFSDESLKAITKFKHLKSLQITDASKVTDSGMVVLGNFTNLHNLKLISIPEVTDKGLENIWNMNKLHTLDLDLKGEILDVSIDNSIKGIKLLDQLEELTMHGIITDEGLKYLESLKKLRVLDLSQCRGYTDAGLASLMNSMPNLQVLKIHIEAAPKQEKK